MKALWLACLLLLMPGVAVAEPKMSGSETVGDFRGWPEGIQVGYIVGWRSHAAALSVGCDRQTTHGEQVAALKYDPRLSPSDLLTRVMILLEIRDGCKVVRP